MSERPHTFDTQTVRAPTLQRACTACAAKADGERERYGVQTKLTVSDPGDRWEQEADRIADAVVADRPTPLSGPLSVTANLQRQEADMEEEEEELQTKPADLQRQDEGPEGEEELQTKPADLQCQEEEEEEPLQARRASAHAHGAAPGRDFAARLSSESQGGEALDPATRAAFEPRFGRDLSGVRLHAGGGAAALSRRINARAFTHRNHIFFAGGQLDTRSRAGRHLLAHEIVHTFQQGHGGPTAPQLQRRNFLEEFAGLFRGDSFDDEELRAYLRTITTANAIEDFTDSDNKARALVNRLRNGDDWFGFADTGALRALLVKEMQSGWTVGDDERAILHLLSSASEAQLQEMFTTGGLTVGSLEDDFQGAELRQLREFFDSRFDGGRQALLDGDVQPMPARSGFSSMIVERAQRRLAVVEQMIADAQAVDLDRFRLLQERRALDEQGDPLATAFGSREPMERAGAEAMNRRPLRIEISGERVVFHVRFHVRFEDPGMRDRFPELERSLRQGIADTWNHQLSGPSFGGRQFSVEPEVVQVDATAARDQRFWLVTVRPTDLGTPSYPGCNLPEGVQGVPTSITQLECDGGVISIPPRHLDRPGTLGHETLHLFGLVDRYRAVTMMDPTGTRVTGHRNDPTRSTPGRTDPLGSEDGLILAEDLAFVFETQGIYDEEIQRRTGGAGIGRLEAEAAHLREIIELGYDPRSLIQPRRDFNRELFRSADDI